MIEREQLLEHGLAMSELFRQRLEELAETCASFRRSASGA